MQLQNEIKKETKVLNPEGRLNEIGWCRHNLYQYNPEFLAVTPWKLKEWDFYQIANKEHMVQITFTNISIGSAACFTYVNFQTGEKFTDIILDAFTKDRLHMARNGQKPHSFERKKGRKSFSIEVTETKRILKFKNKKITAEFEMENNVNNESITILTPFKNEKLFFLTDKINCMKATGSIDLGYKKIMFDGDDVYGVLDWGRGAWQHKNFWFWGNGSTKINDKLFGFEITWGIGNEENATETALFYDGKCHKLGRVRIEKQPDRRWKEKWVFHEENGRFELTMTPFYDHAAGAIVLFAGLRAHQVHGLWNGTVTLDDGTVLEIKNMYAFCEKVYNKW